MSKKQKIEPRALKDDELESASGGVYVDPTYREYLEFCEFDKQRKKRNVCSDPDGERLPHHGE